MIEESVTISVRPVAHNMMQPLYERRVNPEKSASGQNTRNRVAMKLI